MITLPQHSLTALLKQLGVAALYALLLYIGEAHFESGAIVGYFEPASGLALAALLIGGRRYAWSVPLGAFLINAISDNSLWEVAIVASGDTLQALCGAWLLTREGKFDLRLQSLRDYQRLILLGGGASIAIGALAVNTVLLASGLLAPGNYFHSLIQWWMSDMLGVMLIAPLILAWLGIRKDWRNAWMMAEATLMLGLTILAGQAVFLGGWHDSIGFVARGYWMFLIVTWVAVRIGACGTTVVLVMTAVYALLGATHGVGFFADDIAQTHLVNYWLYMMTLSIVGMALATHFTERKQLEQQLSRRLRHRDVMERISRISLSSATIEELLGRVLDEMLTVFNADRAYFLYPCDPDAHSWSVPMERTRPEWPGAFARGMVIPMTPEVAEVFRELLASTKPLPYGPAASRCIPAAVAEQFSIRSMIQMALRPKVGSPWVIGLHHCAQARAYDGDELLIFKDIGLRVADTLSSMIILKNLRESEENLNHAQAVGQVGSWLLNIVTNRLEWSAETYRMFGIPQQEAVDLDTFDAAAHPDDRNFVLKTWGEAMAGAPYDIEYRIVVGGQERWVRERAQIERDSEGRRLTGIGTVQDITERKQLEMVLRNRTDELALHNQILQQISLGAPLCEVLEELARQIEALHPGMLCSILLVAEDGKHLRHGAAPGLPDFYNQAINGLAIGDGMGACGTAAYRGERVIVEDVQQHDYWPEPYRDLARQAGVQSCWSQPIKDSNGRVLGTFAIYHQKPAQPSDTEIALIERYADLAALVIERVRIQDDLRLKDLALNAAANAIVITGKDAQIKWANRAFSKLSGYDLSEAIGHLPKELVKSGKQSQGYYEAMWQTILSGEVWHGELVNRRKDGSLYHEEMTITPVPDAQGEITHFVAVKQDITERKQAEKELRASEQKFMQFFTLIPIPLGVVNNDGGIAYFNNQFTEVFGYTTDDVPTLNEWWQLAYPDESYRQWVMDSWGAAVAKAAKEGMDIEPAEYRVTCKNGAERVVMIGGAILEEGVLATFIDITERKQAELALKRYKLVIDTVNDGFWITDTMGNMLEANEAYAKMSGYSIDELVNMHISQLEAIERSVEEVVAHIEKIIARGHERFETRHRHKNGHEIDVEVSATFMFELQQFFVFIHDITKRKQAEEQIRNLAFYDTLTQLPNRRLLNDRLGQTLATSKRSSHYGALMFLDLDNFKPLNDTYGHNVGDLLLIEVARRISGCVREVDTVARFGGDEFVVMLGELDADKAESIAQAGIVAEKVRSALAEPYLLKIQQEGKAETTVKHRCAASIGVVVFNSEAGMEDILKWADTAMYQAKERGRDQVYFFNSKS